MAHFDVTLEDGGTAAVGVYGNTVGLVVLPAQVGKFGSRLKKFAKKIAHSKIGKGVAKLAVAAADTFSGGNASRAINIAKKAIGAAKKFGREAKALLPGAQADVLASSARKVRAEPSSLETAKRKLEALATQARRANGRDVTRARVAPAHPAVSPAVADRAELARAEAALTATIGPEDVVLRLARGLSDRDKARIALEIARSRRL